MTSMEFVMSEALSNLESMLVERDATLAVLKPRYFGGEVMAILTQTEDEDYLGILRSCDGWQYVMNKNPWYPMFRGKSAEAVLEKVRNHVNSVPEEHLSTWLVACFDLEHSITQVGWSDNSYPDDDLGLVFLGWEMPYGWTKEWVETTYIEVALEVLTPNGTPVQQLTVEEMAEEVKSSSEEIERFITLRLEGRETKEEVRDLMREWIADYDRNR